MSVTAEKKGKMCIPVYAFLSIFCRLSSPQEQAERVMTMNEEHRQTFLEVSSFSNVVSLNHV